MDAAVSYALCCIYQSFAWFPMVTGQAERMTGSLVKISPPLSIAYLPPLHWTVVHICCRENRPHLCKWGGHVLRHTPFTAAQQLVRSSAYEWLCLVDLAAYLQDVSLLYWTLSTSNSHAKLKQGVMRSCCCCCAEHHVGADHSLTFVDSKKAFVIYVLSVQKRKKKKKKKIPWWL